MFDFISKILIEGRYISSEDGVKPHRHYPIAVRQNSSPIESTHSGRTNFRMHGNSKGPERLNTVNFKMKPGTGHLPVLHNSGLSTSHHKSSSSSSSPSAPNIDSSKPSLLNRLRNHVTNHKLAYSVGTGAAAAGGAAGLHAYLKHKKKHSLGNRLRTGAGLAAAAAIAAKTYMNYKKKKTTNPMDPRFWEYHK